MKILLTNDDGIESVALYKLAEELAKKHEIFIMAPDSQRSACSHSLTLSSPLIPKKSERFCAFTKKAYMLNGTTVDCVKIARFSGLIDDFDLVISGINIGPNLGTDVLYSGTVAGALEGAILGKKGIALSINSHTPENIPDIAGIAANLVSELDLSVLPHDSALNINFPDLKEEKIKGVKFVKLGVSRYIDEIKSAKHPDGYDYFWLSGEVDFRRENLETDMHYINLGYITVTPVIADLTNNEVIKTLENNFTGSTV